MRPNNLVEPAGPERPAAHEDRWADQWACTMPVTTRAVDFRSQQHGEPPGERMS